MNLKKEQKEMNADEMADKMPLSLGDPVALLAVGSVGYSWYHYYIKGDTDYGIFTGLWAPTLLAGASYLQNKHIVRRVRESLSSF